MKTSHHEWLTITEAVHYLNQTGFPELNVADILRYALNRMLTLSVWFSCPVIIHLVEDEDDENQQKPYLFQPGKKPLITTQGLWDLTLNGCAQYEVQQLLASELNYPFSPADNCEQNLGFLVYRDVEVFQVYQRLCLQRMIASAFGKNVCPDVLNNLTTTLSKELRPLFERSLCLPVCKLPIGAQYVFRKQHLQTFVKRLSNSDAPGTRTTLTSAKLIWLLCKKNPVIDEQLLQHPYKLAPLLEHWFKEEGYPTSVNGDTIKQILARGAP